MRLRVLLEEADALIDVLRVPVDGRHRDAGEVVREEAAGSVVVAVQYSRRCRRGRASFRDISRNYTPVTFAHPAMQPIGAPPAGLRAAAHPAV